jgi:hypothetical protein
MTDNSVILRMNIQHYEGLLRFAEEGARRQQIQKMLAETRADLKSVESLPAAKR